MLTDKLKINAGLIGIISAVFINKPLNALNYI